MRQRTTVRSADRICVSKNGSWWLLCGEKSYSMLVLRTVRITIVIIHTLPQEVQRYWLCLFILNECPTSIYWRWCFTQRRISSVAIQERQKWTWISFDPASSSKAWCVSVFLTYSNVSNIWQHMLTSTLTTYSKISWFLVTHMLKAFVFFDFP